MLDTISLFDVIEADDRGHREAARKALALAHTRTDHSLGRFLRAAQSEEEFEERLALVQDDFTYMVANSSAEVGHEHPEHIAAALRDHYHHTANIKEACSGCDAGECLNCSGGSCSCGSCGGKGKKSSINWRIRNAEPFRLGSNPAEQRDTSPDQVTCPQCGGSGRTAGDKKCGKCKGKGDVPNFGDSMVDNVGANLAKTAEKGNTDLGEPEPKMDKDRWTETNPSKEEVEEPSKYHPNIRKDMVEVIGPMSNESDRFKEIGEKTTERKSLPAAKDDEAGFADGGEVKGPEKWQGGNEQTDPVTREALSKADDVYVNPLIKLLAEDRWPSDAAVQAALSHL